MRCTEVADQPLPDGYFTCRDIGDRGRSGFEAIPGEDHKMTDKSRDFFRWYGYVIVGLLAGLAIGIGLGPRLRDFVISNGWPNESITYITMSLVLISTMLNGFLYQGWKKDDYRKSDTNPPAKSGVDH
ncbi:MAG: hypothetical protein ACK517_04510 [bacterium]|jgi:hypothetical protein